MPHYETHIEFAELSGRIPGTGEKYLGDIKAAATIQAGQRRTYPE